MSNFLTFSQASGGLTGTAPRLFTASTNDNYSTLTTTGYMSDKVANGEVARRDILWINYDVDGTIASGVFIVSQTDSLDPYTGAAGSYGRALLNIKSGTTLTGAGPGPIAYAAAGLVAADVVTATILSSTNVVGIAKAVPTTNTLTVTFTADPGASAIVQWHAITPTP